MMLFSFVLGALLFGSASWPYRETMDAIWTDGTGRGASGGGLDRLSQVGAAGTVSHGGGGVANGSEDDRWRDLVDSPSEDISATSSPSSSMDYRRHLEMTTSPSGFLQHSPTLGFTHIYVLSLPHRTDRRKTMSKLAAALGIHVTFIDAVTKESSVISWIAERASEVRDLKRRLIAEHLGVSEGAVGGMGVGTVWLTTSASRGGSRANQARLRGIQFPSLALKAYGGKDWITHLWDPSTDHSTLHASDPNFNVTKAMFDPLERIPERQISAATVSTFYNHLRVMREMEKNGDRTALVLEDDVDVEWDLERRWMGMLRRLPRNWEAVFLGHCWGKELYGTYRTLLHQSFPLSEPRRAEPQYLHPNLHKSTAPLCLHGFATSSVGRQRLLSLLMDPWLAFQTPIDTCLPTFISMGLRAFSVEPPIINQAKVGISDIQQGTGSPWKGVLADSTLERIWKDESRPFLEETYEQSRQDPASTSSLSYLNLAFAILTPRPPHF